MKISPVILFSLIILAFSSCKSKTDKPAGAINSLSDLKDYAENIEKAATQSTSRREERKAKGDTVALPYKDLQAYLPQVNGYTTAEGPTGSQMNTPGLGSMSQGEQHYTNGDKKLSVSIVDYNAAQQAFLGLTAMYGMGMSFEDDTKKQAPVDLGIKNVSAYETIYKKDKRSEMIMIIADRFIVSLNNDGEGDESFLRTVAKDMKLDEMAAK